MANYTLGSDLHPDDKRAACNQFVYRMTHESVKSHPQTNECMIDGGYRLTLISDAEWLASTVFVVKKDGRLDKRSHFCEHDTKMFRTIKPRD